MDDLLDNTTNEALAGNVYPASGSTVAMSATAGNVGGRTSGSAPIGNSGGSAANLPQGSLVAGLVTFIALLVIVMLVARKWGDGGDDFKNVKASFYNVIFISLVAVAGIPVIKIGVVKLADMGVPMFDHLATWALAA